MSERLIFELIRIKLCRLDVIADTEALRELISGDAMSPAMATVYEGSYPKLTMIGEVAVEALVDCFEEMR